MSSTTVIRLSSYHFCNTVTTSGRNVAIFANSLGLLVMDFQEQYSEKVSTPIHHLCKFRCMGRTNINLDDELISKGLKITGLRTKRELVDLALRELIRKEDQKSILALEGKFSWDGNLDELRKGRFDR